MASLEQQVEDIRVNPETKSAESTANLEDSRLATGEGRPTALHSLSAPSLSPEGISEGSAETTAGRSCPSEPKKRGSGQAEYDFEGALEDGEPTEEDYQQAQRVETYMMGLINRRALPQRPPKPSPRTSLAHDARAAVARQGSLCRKEELASPGPGSEALAPPQLDPERYAGLGEDPHGSPGYHHHHHLHQLQATAQLQPGHYPRPRQPSGAGTPRCAPLLPPHDSNSNSEPDSPPPHFHHGYTTSNPPPPHARPSCSHGDEQQMVNAEYVPAQPCRASTRASAHHHHHLPSAHRGAAAGPKPSRGTYSPERGAGAAQLPEQLQHGRVSRGGPRKCRAAEDRAGGGGASATSVAGVARKQGKKACRSQSENSLQRATPPERKYNTAERDGAGSGSGGGGGGGRGGGGGGGRSGQPRSKKPQQQQPGGIMVSGSHRRWRSTLELSQDEAEQQLPPPAAAPSAGQREHCGRRARKTRPPAPSAFAPPHHGHAHHHGEYQADPREPVQGNPRGDAYGLPGQGESESSTSEADSPESSTLSSDSDESGGGLVWPQQLPPQLSAVLPSPPATHGAGGEGGGAAPPLQPKAFVKIKASHALKKKILRFRTGSLKVMTTV